MKLTVAVSGLNAGENPQPGPGVIRSLRRCFDEVCIVGLAYGPFESAIYADDSADVVYRIPCLSAGADAFMQRLDYIQSRHPVDILIPTLDAEILTLIQLQKPLQERGIRSLLPSVESFLARSKQNLEDMSTGTGVYLPESITVQSEDMLAFATEKLHFPVMVKGPSYEAIRADCAFELSSAFSKIMREWGGPVIVQEFIGGGEFNIAAVGDGKGGMEAACAIRKTVRSAKGKGYGGIVITAPELLDIGRRILEKLNWNGPCELEFVQDEESGRFFLIEMNPRFPAWIDFPSTFGYNLPKLVVDRLRGVSSTLPASCPPGHFFLRHAVDISGKIEDLGQLTALGELARSERGAAGKEEQSFSSKIDLFPSCTLPSSNGDIL